MRISSVYSVYREYFSYSKSENPKLSRNFALSIRDSSEVIGEICRMHNIDPIQEYEERTKKSALTSKFLNNAQNILIELNKRDIANLKYVFAEIWVPPDVLQCKTRYGTYIPVPYIVNQSSKQIINLTFGRPESIKNELRVLKGLNYYFSIDCPWPQYDSFVYWDLCGGKKSSANLSSIVPVSKESIISVLNRLVA